MPDRKFSHSSMSTYRRCRYKYYLHYVKDFDSEPSMGQIRGSVGHSALAAWYTTHSREKAMKAAADKLHDYEDLISRNFDDEWEKFEVILPRYFDWSIQNDPFTQVIACEQRFDLVIDGVSLIGYIDGIVEINGVRWLLEHKFYSSIRTKALELDAQVSIYLLAATELGLNPRGVLYNCIRMTLVGKAEEEPVVRLPVYRNSEALEQIKLELSEQLREMDSYHKQGGNLYRNPTDDCSWDCGFFAACLAINDTGDPTSVLERFPRRERVVEELEKDENHGV